MTCEEFWNGEPHALDHLRECRPCATRAERQQRLAASLSRLGAEMRHLEAPEHVERLVVAGFRGRVGLLPPARPAGWWWAATGWAAAIALTTGLALFVAVGRQPQRTERITRHATQLAAAEFPADVDPAEDGGFIPLPNAEALGPNEEVNLVRIEAPRSMMIAVGFSVDADEAGEPVEADVMLGADGVARAIRFLE
jgi:HAMP domain-containing protein